MIETKEKIIGDSTYAVTQMPAMRAIKLQARLLKLVGPSLAAMIVSDPENPDSCLPMAVGLLADKLNPDDFENLVITLLQGVRKDGVEISKDKANLDFAGKLNELYLVLQFVLEANFSDFFQDGGIIAELKKAADKTRVSPELKKT